MKKINTFIAIFLLTMVNSQEVRYGVTGNFHQGSILGVHDVSKGKFGASIGALAEFTLAEGDISGTGWLFLVPQVEYSMQGEHAKAEQNKFGVQKFNHDYVAAQLYLKYFFKRNYDISNFFLFAGPRVEFLVREDRQVDPAYDLAYYQYNMDSTLNNLGIGVSVGVGAKVGDNLEGFLRYDRGFTKVYPDNTMRNTYNHQLAVGVNYYFNSF